MDQFASLVRHLKKQFSDHKVSVRRCPTPNFGDCLKLADGSFRIRVTPLADRTGQIMILIHEWAHVLSWKTDHHHSNHGPEFGRSYSRVWRSYLDWLELLR